ncbi:MAG TPA: hypothetical protein VMD77_05875 [Candidatus Baltobacteraceae bacterium]|nr:hypothetical protein [Candidatus Baltobacteraceae bacterium]
MSKKYKKWEQRKHDPEHHDPPAPHMEGETGMVYTVRIEPHPKEKDRYAEEQQYRKDQLNKATRLNQISAFGAAIALFALLALIYNACLIQQQLTTSEAANGISKTQMRLSVRPWVGVDDSPDAIRASRIFFDQDGNATIGYALTFKNYSSFAAQNVIAVPMLVITDDGTTIQNEIDMICGNNFMGKDFGPELWPGKQRYITGYQDKWPRDHMVSKSPDGTVGASIVGCIGYRDQFDWLYKSPFRYSLVDPKTHTPIRITPTPLSSVTGQWLTDTGSIGTGEQAPKTE